MSFTVCRFAWRVEMVIVGVHRPLWYPPRALSYRACLILRKPWERLSCGVVTGIGDDWWRGM
jgi:hypothetical protein